jgi:hypothetical protein
MSKQLTKLNVFQTPTSVVLSAKLKLLVDQQAYDELKIFAEFTSSKICILLHLYV